MGLTNIVPRHILGFGEHIDNAMDVDMVTLQLSVVGLGHPEGLVLPPKD